MYIIYFIVGDDISYVWVTKGDSIPHEEKTHGLLNIINTAKQNPDSTINVYIDSEQNQISYTLPANINQPKNIKFIKVSELIEQCKIKAKYKKEDSDVIDDAYKLYLLEMEHGHPAYAGNFIKLLALYRGGIVSDIGVVYDEKTFSDLKDLKIKNIIDIKKGFLYNLKGLFGVFKDDKFHIAEAPLLWSSEKQNKSVYQAIKCINDHYKNGASLGIFLKNIDKISFDVEKVKLIKEEIYSIYGRSHYQSHSKNIKNAVPAIKSGKLALEIGYKFQDKGYGFALGNNSITSCLLPPMLLNHKISHLDKDFYHASAEYTYEASKVVEKSVPRSNIARTSSLNKAKKYVIPTVPKRRGSATGTVKVKEVVKSPTSLHILYQIKQFLKRKHKVKPDFSFF